MNDSNRVIFRIHAIKRMFQRNISEQDVRRILINGEIIENYADDKPYPSQLILGWIDERPIHVVWADNIKDNEIIIITVYEPDTSQWTDDFKRRII